MAAPVITMAYNTVDSETPTWLAIGASEVITFTGAGSSDGDLKPITRPIAGVRVADELWIDKATDAAVLHYDGGGQEVGDFATDVFTANPVNTNVLAILASTNSETSAGILRAWDDTNYNTIIEESIAGTANMAHSFWRAIETGSNVSVASGAGTIPAAAYQNQIATLTTYQLQGDTFELQFTTALTAGNQNRFVLHLLIPDDAVNLAQASMTISLTYHFFYT